MTFPVRDITTGPTPQVALRSRRSGARFLLEVRSGVQAERMSIVTDGLLRAVRDAAGVESRDLALVTTAEPPACVRDGLALSGIAWWAVRTPAEVMERLEPVLARLSRERREG